MSDDDVVEVSVYIAAHPLDVPARVGEIGKHRIGLGRDLARGQLTVPHQLEDAQAPRRGDHLQRLHGSLLPFP